MENNDDVNIDDELKKLMKEDLTEEDFKERMLELAIKSGGERMLTSMVMTKEISKSHDKVNAMFEAAQNGKLYPAVYVALMKNMSDMWLKEMKKKIIENGDKEELQRYEESLELIKETMEDSGAFKMITTTKNDPATKKDDGTYIS